MSQPRFWPALGVGKKQMQPPNRKSHNKYRFPWRSGHRFQLLVDGREFYAAMLNRIALAERYVLLEMYLFESGRVADRFIDSTPSARYGCASRIASA
jgi:phosphatidylserine/phosphatidylglycerophosphate/cardiolipin synthase-like enzyme